jgi:hypothetical protein
MQQQQIMIIVGIVAFSSAAGNSPNSSAMDGEYSRHFGHPGFTCGLGKPMDTLSTDYSHYWLGAILTFVIHTIH